MLDTLIIHVPMQDEFVTQLGNLFSIRGDVADYQITAVPSYLKRDMYTGEITYGDLRHPYEALPSSYSNMAIKFNAVNVANVKPYISLNASVKILQGHNVYGGDNVGNLAAEMLSLLQEHYPAFYACLAIDEASISRIDATYSVRLEHERLVQPCIKFLSNISNGQRRNDKKQRQFFNTAYFGGRTSRHGGAKVYGKHHEMMDSIKELRKKADSGCLQSAQKLQVFTPELLEWSKCLLRFESSTKKRRLQQLNMPVNLWDFIRYQQKNRDALTVIWKHWFNPIIDALKGDVMDDYSDAEIYELCMSKLTTVTATGKISKTKANNAYNFYKLLQQDGWEDVKQRYTNPTFHRNVKSLVDIGISKALLQNLAEQKKQESIPVVELIKFDFSNQYPPDYVPPISTHIRKFDKYIKPKLRKVA